MLATKQELMLDRNKDIKDFVDEFTDGARNRNRYRREIEDKRIRIWRFDI